MTTPHHEARKQRWLGAMPKRALVGSAKARSGAERVTLALPTCASEGAALERFALLVRLKAQLEAAGQLVTG